MLICYIDFLNSDLAWSMLVSAMLHDPNVWQKPYKWRGFTQFHGFPSMVLWLFLSFWCGVYHGSWRVYRSCSPWKPGIGEKEQNQGKSVRVAFQWASCLLRLPLEFPPPPELSSAGEETLAPSPPVVFGNTADSLCVWSGAICKWKPLHFLSSLIFNFCFVHMCVPMCGCVHVSAGTWRVGGVGLPKL